MISSERILRRFCFKSDNRLVFEKPVVRVWRSFERWSNATVDYRNVQSLYHWRDIFLKHPWPQVSSLESRKWTIIGCKHLAYTCLAVLLVSFLLPMWLCIAVKSRIVWRILRCDIVFEIDRWHWDGNSDPTQRSMTFISFYRRMDIWLCFYERQILSVIKFLLNLLLC